MLWLSKARHSYYRRWELGHQYRCVPKALFTCYQSVHTFVHVAKNRMEERQTFRLPNIPETQNFLCLLSKKLTTKI